MLGFFFFERERERERDSSIMLGLLLNASSSDLTSLTIFFKK